jgi:hypothetical protein
MLRISLIESLMSPISELRVNRAFREWGRAESLNSSPQNERIDGVAEANGKRSCPKTKLK